MLATLACTAVAFSPQSTLAPHSVTSERGLQLSMTAPPAVVLGRRSAVAAFAFASLPTLGAHAKTIEV
jgi:hypothetical protein